MGNVTEQLVTVMLPKFKVGASGTPERSQKGPSC